MAFNFDELLKETDQLAEEEASNRENDKESGDGDGSERGGGLVSETDSVTEAAKCCSNDPGQQQQLPARQQQQQMNGARTSAQHQEPRKWEKEKLAKLKEQTSQVHRQKCFTCC